MYSHHRKHTGRGSASDRKKPDARPCLGTENGSDKGRAANTDGKVQIISNSCQDTGHEQEKGVFTV
jgi:hypothetical protein